MELSIRMAGKGDAAMIAAFSRVTFYDSYAAFNTPENMKKYMKEQFSQEMLEAEVGMKENVFLLAFEGEELAGYAKLVQGSTVIAGFDPLSVEIGRIYAAKKKIGKGVGAALMKRCLEWGTANGCEEICLAVWKQNERAIRFYRKWGFEIAGETDFLLGNDWQKDWLMKRKIVNT